MTRVHARVSPTAVVGALALVAAGYVYTTQTDAPPREGRTVIRVEAMISVGGMHVAHADASSVHGARTHADGDYARTYARDVLVGRGEVVRTEVTVTVGVNTDRRRSVMCLIKENGKTVTGPYARTIRVGEELSDPLTCVRVTRG